MFQNNEVKKPKSYSANLYRRSELDGYSNNVSYDLHVLYNNAEKDVALSIVVPAIVVNTPFGDYPVDGAQRLSFSESPVYPEVQEKMGNAVYYGDITVYDDDEEDVEVVPALVRSPESPRSSFDLLLDRYFTVPVLPGPAPAKAFTLADVAQLNDSLEYMNRDPNGCLLDNPRQNLNDVELRADFDWDPLRDGPYHAQPKVSERIDVIRLFDSVLSEPDRQCFDDLMEVSPIKLDRALLTPQQYLTNACSKFYRDSSVERHYEPMHLGDSLDDSPFGKFWSGLAIRDRYYAFSEWRRHNFYLEALGPDRVCIINTCAYGHDWEKSKVYHIRGDEYIHLRTSGALMPRNSWCSCFSHSKLGILTVYGNVYHESTCFYRSRCFCVTTSHVRELAYASGSKFLTKDC